MAPTCPTCDSPGRPLIFGLPTREAERASSDGLVALGGCLLPRPADLVVRQGPLVAR